jgi:hypothetical protein
MSSILLKHLIIRREFHGGEGVKVLSAFREEIIPGLDQSTFALIVDEVENIICPSLSHLVGLARSFSAGYLSQVLFQCHLPLCLYNDFSQ